MCDPPPKKIEFTIRVEHITNRIFGTTLAFGCDVVGIVICSVAVNSLNTRS